MDKKEEELHQEIKAKTELAEQYDQLMREKEIEGEQLHQDMRELNSQLMEKVTKKESRPPVSSAPTESGYESTGSVITVINTKHSYAEVAKRKGKEKEKEKGRPTAERTAMTSINSYKSTCCSDARS